MCWGRDGFNALWAAATIKLIGAGIDDAAHLEEISRLVGEHDITTRSTTHTRCARGNSGGSETLALRRQRVLPAVGSAPIQP